MQSAVRCLIFARNSPSTLSEKFSMRCCLRIIVAISILTVVILLAVVYQRTRPTISLGAQFGCDIELLKPSTTVPTNVNAVRPADIKLIGALGDSITIALHSKNFEGERNPRSAFIGNSFVTGGDEPLGKHITLANIIKEVNPKLIGMSHGDADWMNLKDEQRGFNVAVGGVTVFDLPRQAAELVEKIKKSTKVDLQNDWKLITIFIGTNDIKTWMCGKKPIITANDYKSKMEEAITIMKKGLPRTIVTIISIWNSPLSIEANSMLYRGARYSCDGVSVKHRDEVINSYRKVSYEIQNERKIDTEDFTVVVQCFMDDIRDAFRDEFGEYNTRFYAGDIFHLSKYGNAVMAKYLWNGLMEPVGKKNKKADLSNDLVPLKCPSEDRPFIRTLGNS